MTDELGLTRLQETIEQKPSLQEQWAQGIIDGLDPNLSQGGKYAKYQKDPVGFCENELNLNLTEDQKAMLLAFLEYPITQVASATGVGKTFALAALAVWVYKTYIETKVYTASAPPEANLRELLWGEIYSLAKDCEEMFAADTIKQSLKIERHPKQYIIGVSIPVSKNEREIVTRFSGKHARILAFLFDEGDGIPDPVYEGADGCMSGGEFVRQIVCFNPKEKRGVPYHREKNGTAKTLNMSAFNHPNVITGDNVVPGAVTREKTVERINLWTEPKPIDKEVDATCFKVPEYLIGTTAQMPNGKISEPLRPGYRVVIDGQFDYKVRGQYPVGAADQLFWDSWIDDAIYRWELMRASHGGVVTPPAGIQPHMGYDVAGDGADSHAYGFRYGHWWDVPTMHKEVQPHKAAMKAVRLYRERNAKDVAVDTIGVGAGTPGIMESHGRELGLRIKVKSIKVSESASGWNEDGECELLRDEAYWNVRVALRDAKIALPPPTHNEACKRMHEAMRIMTYEERKKIKVMDKKVMRRKLGYSPDELECFVLTYATAKNWMGGIRRKNDR